MVDNVTNITNITNVTTAVVTKEVPIIMGLSPFWFILLISIALSLIVAFIYKYATDQALMKELKADLKKYQEQMKAAKDEPQKMMEIQKKAMAVNMKYMGQSMKPMLITIIPFIIIFTILSRIYSGVPVIPLPFNFLGKPYLGWIGTYIIFSMIFTTLFRKALKVA